MKKMTPEEIKKWEEGKKEIDYAFITMMMNTKGRA